LNGAREPENSSTHRFAVREAGAEHQNGISGGMFRKDAKHHPPVVVLEVKEAALDAGLINPRSNAAIGIPRGRMTIAMGYNPVHPSNLACDHIPASDVLVDGSEICNGSNRRGHGDDARLCLLAEETLSL
jgi:hypothetical protein